MSAKKASILSPRKLFETEELPHFGFYKDSSPPTYDSIPSVHKNILLWIGEYAATYDLEKVVQALTDSFEGIWASNSQAYDRVMLSALGVFARTQNFTLGQEALDTLLRIESAKQHPSFRSFVRELKIQLALAVVRSDHTKTEEFKETVKSFNKAEQDEEINKELIDFGRLMKKKDTASKEAVAAYFAKHSVERFQKEALQFIKEVKGAQPKPFLEQLESDFTAGTYKPSQDNDFFTYKEIAAAYLEDEGKELLDIYTERDPSIKEFKKKQQQPKKKPSKSNSDESDEEPLQTKKKKKDVSPNSKRLETRETLTQLDKESNRLFAHGKDPLSEARKKAPKKIVSSSAETTPTVRSTTSSAASTGEKLAVIDRRNTAQAIEWNNSDEEEDEFRELEEELVLHTPKRLLEDRELNRNNFVSPSGKTVRRRIKWTTEEEDMLLEGYIRFPLQWARIRRKYDFTGRTGVDLKDKYRNLMKHFDDTQQRVTRITQKLEKQREDRIARGLKADETDSEAEKIRQRESAKKHARKRKSTSSTKSKSTYDGSEPEAESEEEEEDEDEGSDSQVRKRKPKARRASWEAKKKFKPKKVSSEEEEDNDEDDNDSDYKKDRRSNVEEQEDKDEQQTKEHFDEENQPESDQESKPKKTVKKSRRGRRRIRY